MRLCNFKYLPRPCSTSLLGASTWSGGWSDAEAETPILWPPDTKNWLTGKDPEAGKDWRQEKKGMTEDEMVGWYHRLDGREFKLRELVMDRDCMLQSMGSQRVRHDWVTELNWTWSGWGPLGKGAGASDRAAPEKLSKASASDQAAMGPISACNSQLHSTQNHPEKTVALGWKEHCTASREPQLPAPVLPPLSPRLGHISSSLGFSCPVCKMKAWIQWSIGLLVHSSSFQPLTQYFCPWLASCQPSWMWPWASWLLLLASSSPVILRQGSLGQQRQHHLWTCHKYRFLDPTPDLWDWRPWGWGQQSLF